MTAAEINALMREAAELLYQHCLNSEAAGLVRKSPGGNQKGEGGGSFLGAEKDAQELS
jgi:hypothetical protein